VSCGLDCAGDVSQARQVSTRCLREHRSDEGEKEEQAHDEKLTRSSANPTVRCQSTLHRDPPSRWSLPLARLGLARAYARQGDTAKAKAAHEDFLRLWKGAGPDIRILKQAQAENAKLQ
jgi:hypothetical protein